VTERVDGWTTGYVALLALIVVTVSYLHLYRLVTLRGQPE
jgi:hypothetical protein